MWDNYSTTFDQTFDHCAPRTVVRVRIWQRIKFYEFLVLDKRWKQAATRLMSLGEAWRGRTGTLCMLVRTLLPSFS